MRVRYVGRTGDLNYEVAAECGVLALERGCTYNVSKELADRLLPQAGKWQTVLPKSRRKPEAADGGEARGAGHVA